MKTWIVAQPEEALVKKITQSISISPMLARLLVNRKRKTPEAVNEFLYPQLAGLHDPFLFPQMALAVDRVQQAIHRKERILIYGDYDADGLTGTTILSLVLRKYTNQVYTRIPHRLDEGYGLNSEAIQEEKQNGIDLIIAVDCGITATAEAELTKELGLDLIITDHHTLGDQFPAALAILHPHLPNSGYPFQYLAGVGVAFKFAQAISATLENKRSANLELLEYLDLVAIGTICDVVPLIGENRILTKFGLQQLTKTARPGLQALIAIAGIAHRKMGSEQVAYQLGPRLNAAGRMGHAEVALNLLLTENAEQAIFYARQLNEYNQQRQQIELDILSEAEEQLQSAGGTPEMLSGAVVLADESWHQGVLGIVAGKLAEKYARPVVLFRLNEDEWTGSARGIYGFNLMQALGQCDHIKYGGHWKAAGLTVARTRLAQFREQFHSVTTAMLAEIAGTPSISIDAEITLSELSERFLKEELPLLEPYGTDNPEPTFIARNLTLIAEPKLLKEKHLKLRFNSLENIQVVAMGYQWLNRFDSIPTYGERYEVAFTPKLNNYQGMETIELQIKDIRKA